MRFEQSGDLDKKPFRIPQHDPIMRAFMKTEGVTREDCEMLEVILDEMGRQGLENFDIFKTSMPGVSLPFTRITVTSKLIEALQKKERGREEDEISVDTSDVLNRKKRDIFLFTAFGPPPDEDAFTPGDLAIDRIIRSLASVRKATKRGASSLEVNVYLLGSPTGFGGSVTEDWLKQVKQDGFEGHGKIAAEFIETHLSENSEDKCLIQGASMGAIVAERAYHHLSKNFRKRTKCLLDNPAGDHDPHLSWWKGTQLVVGNLAEALIRIAFDDVTRSVMGAKGKFFKDLARRKNIEEGNKQFILKLRVALAQVGALYRGTLRDKDARYYLRQGMWDPLSFSVKRIYDIWLGKKHLFKDGDKSIEGALSHTHFFMYNRYKGWARRMQNATRQEEEGDLP